MMTIPVWEKLYLSVKEAAEYTGVGMHKIRELMCEQDCDFVLKVGTKKSLIKREKLERYLESHEAI